MIPFTLGDITLQIDPDHTGRLNSGFMTGGIASCCECEECTAIELLAFLCLRPELAQLLASCNVDPCRNIYRIVSSKRRGDPDGFKRILWAWPLCGSDVDFSFQKPQHLSGQDYAWLSKEAPALDYHWDPDSKQTLETAEPNICAWLFVSRLNPFLEATAETFVKEYFMEPCCTCRCEIRLSFFPKRKSWVHKEIAGRIGAIGSHLKGHRLKASFCARCHENFSLWVPDKAPFFNSAAVRKQYKEWRKSLGLKRYHFYYSSPEVLSEMLVNSPVQPPPESAESPPPVAETQTSDPESPEVPAGQ